MWNSIVRALGDLLRGRRRRESQQARAEYWGVEREELPDWRAQRRLERDKLRLERGQLDRKSFGEETWGASERHRKAACDQARLEAQGLPVLRTEQELAAWLDIPLGRLRWFTHDRPADPVWHYVCYRVPKKTGGERVILAPKRQLKALQRRVLDTLLAKVPAGEAAHGFVRGRSILSNARPHVGKGVVLGLDLVDFFPSITFPRVRGIFVSLGYPFSVASALALLCTEHEREAVEHAGRTLYVSVTPRALAQGAPTSPALANLAARRLDRRLAGLARHHGFDYTRYADDLTFSGADRAAALRLLAAARRVVRDEQFEPHPLKTHLTQRSARQAVTGVVVNERPGLARSVRRRLRAMLHEAGKAADGPAGPGQRAALAGLVGHAMAVKDPHASVFQQRLKALP
jgi:RNA-directed DNA polymerase